jgi:hypothetical protein
MNAGKHLHHIADDHQRGVLVRIAVDKGVEQARGDFFHALLVEGLDDETLMLFAGEAWDSFSRLVEFDYPQFAQTLFLQAYRSAYHAHLLQLASGKHANTHDLVAAIEAEIGLTSA